MKHATPAALDQLEDLLAALRALDGLTEKKRGIFYRRSKAFCHFHEDPAGLFGDLLLPDGEQRRRVSTAAERRAFVAAVRRTLSG